MKKIVITIMLMLGLGTVSLSANENTSKGVVEAFLKALLNNDGQKAKNYLDEKSFIAPINWRKPQLGTRDTRDQVLSERLNGLFGDWQVKDKQIKDTSKYEFQIEPYNEVNEFIIHIKNKTSSKAELQEFQSGLNGFHYIIGTKNINGKWKISTFL